MKSWGDVGEHEDSTPEPSFSSSADMRPSREFFTFSAICAFVGAGDSLDREARLPDGRAALFSSPEPLHPAQKTATRPSDAVTRTAYRFIIDPFEW
ncbi:hypothetical protein [Streptomyces sp. NRRL B-3229]|uniref:hypothetical protein n=1 Tax=Streptomyces sp. NRRL B-3229 TaxID=1463836 RepID=UPI00131D3759|nr:hypothetical protein [Streptomyces sp. NRRL B-3229]